MSAPEWWERSIHQPPGRPPTAETRTAHLSQTDEETFPPAHP
jgi:hypothetical protein